MFSDYRISRSKLKRLAEHKYSVEGTSIMDAYFQVFWKEVVEWVPLWCAPNALTLTGLVINAVSAGLLMVYSPNAIGYCPTYTYILGALGLFLYQTLDAIDGKQARRTGTSSPLGELFDHGCDSMSIVLVIVSYSIMLQLGHSPALLLYVCFSSMFIFYAAHWQTYCSGTLQFGKLDVTEGQVAIIILFILSAVLGPAFWSVEIPWLGLETKLVPVFISVTATLYAAYNYFMVILVRGGIGRNGSTVADTSVLSPLVPIALLLTLAVTLWNKSITNVFVEHIVLYVMSFGMASAKITNKLVLAHMSRSEMEMLDRSLLGPGLIFLNQYFDTFFNEYLVLWLCFLFCTIDLIWYIYNVCLQICDHLDIYCFHIPYPPTLHSTSAHLSSSAHMEGTRNSDASKARPAHEARRSVVNRNTTSLGHRNNGDYSRSSSSSESVDSVTRMNTRSTMGSSLFEKVK